MKPFFVQFSIAALFAACASAAEPPHFAAEILPVLTKAGCNSGACHGAATGQGGFRLSLLGYDPEDDFERITREAGARRIDLAYPDDSLILRKPSLDIDHEGGRKLPRDSDGYELLRRWIEAKTPYGSPGLRVTGVSVEPADVLLASPGEALQLHVTASLSDGTLRDVTKLALYTSNDEAVAEVSKSGSVAASGRGLTSIMIRYSGQVSATRLAVPFEGPAAPADPAPQTGVGTIDSLIASELERLRIPASPLSSDAEFLRRIHLDLVGQLPSSDQVRSVLSEPPSPAKRTRIIDELLASPGFVDLWTMRLADLLLVNGRTDAAFAYHQWLRGQIAANVPIDAIARALLTSSGALKEVPSANFLTLASDPRDLSEHVSRIFLGVQLACARCHAHPADRWTQEDYHRFAAYFANITHEHGVVRLSDRGEVEHPKTGEALDPKPPGSPAPSHRQGATRLDMLAAWVTDPGNPFFARAFVNRIWKHLLGRGLVEPVDDLRPTNPPTHPALLDALAGDFAASGFDIRALIRMIVSSKTYQRSSRTLEGNRNDSLLYSHAYLKELAAPVFADAVARATGVPDAFPGYSPGTRAVQLATPAVPSPALDLLGRCQRVATCDRPAQSGGGVARTLHLINGSTVNAKLKGGVLTELFDFSSGNLVEELYCRTLSRMPTPDESTEWSAFLDTTPDPTAAAEDLLWTLLNSREFGFNH